VTNPALAAIRSTYDRLTHRQHPIGPAHILAVDDEDGVRRFVGRALTAAGYVITVAGDGPEALEATTRIPPIDLLVVDVNMPQMAGHELARRLRQAMPSLKVLYLTGYADTLFSDRATLWADEAYLEKPCSIKALHEAVSLLLYGDLVPPPWTPPAPSSEI
jgi:two-component system cell cycle sensor histidine kinase/response regulator CckA